MIRVISYGGGVQSTALVVLAATGRLDEILGGPVDAALFANVGDDSEHPDSLAYVRTVATPWAAERGLPIHELSRRPVSGRWVGQTETLYGRLMREGNTSASLPVHLAGTNVMGQRSCTNDFKVRVITRWLKEHGATKTERAITAIGISTDEALRANNGIALDKRVDEIVYPLLTLGLSRGDCGALIADAGLPVPPKSSCYFCPFNGRKRWSEMRRDRPDLFDKTVEMERTLNERRLAIGKPPVWWTAKARPLDEVIEPAQEQLFDTDWIPGDGCESGHCWT